jgi:hypothetical protein
LESLVHLSRLIVQLTIPEVANEPGELLDPGEPHNRMVREARGLLLRLRERQLQSLPCRTSLGVGTMEMMKGSLLLNVATQPRL